MDRYEIDPREILIPHANFDRWILLGSILLFPLVKFLFYAGERIRWLCLFLFVALLSSCNLFHSQPTFELEKMSEDVLSNKTHTGISIVITPVENPVGK